MWFTKNSNNLTLYVKISPNAKNNRIMGVIDGENPKRLKISIAAPPQNGAANKELINFLHKNFKLPKACFSVKSGLTSSRKTLMINTSETSQSIILTYIDNILKETQNHVANNQLPLL